jgi:hypothetical protein
VQYVLYDFDKTKKSNVKAYNPKSVPLPYLCAAGNHSIVHYCENIIALYIVLPQNISPAKDHVVYDDNNDNNYKTGNVLIP